MNLWPSRTKMEHAKTRAIQVKNGKDKEEIEIREDEFDVLEKTVEEQKIKLSDYAKDLQRVFAQIKEKDDEIKRLRDIIDKNNIFMQQIIVELINKPAPKSAVELYAANKGLQSVVNSTAGPKGKLP